MKRFKVEKSTYTYPRDEKGNVQMQLQSRRTIKVYAKNKDVLTRELRYEERKNEVHSHWGKEPKVKFGKVKRAW